MFMTGVPPQECVSLAASCASYRTESENRKREKRSDSSWGMYTRSGQLRVPAGAKPVSRTKKRLNHKERHIKGREGR